MSNDIAIKVHNVKKDFHFSHHKSNSLKQSIVQVFKKKDKEVDTFHALRGISFDIKKGEFFGILGRNGSGKSTLLKIISEIYRPTEGTVSHKGTLVSFIELGVGFKPELTGRENVYLNGAMLGFSKEEIDERYAEIVAFAELEEFMEQKIKNYSSGMKVRLAFAVAIQAKSDILVLDEVLAVGDADFQRKCYDYFKSLKDSSKTIVFVTHSMNAVKTYCDKAILIEDGKIIEEGSAEDVADAYTRMFNHSKTNASQQSKERWGSGEVQFSEVASTVDDKFVTIDLEITGQDTLTKDIAIGINIRNSKNVLVTGVESSLQAKHLFTLKTGETVSMRYQFENHFSGDEYKVTVSAKTLDSSHIYDFWKNATTFNDESKSDTYFPSVIPVTISKK